MKFGKKLQHQLDNTIPEWRPKFLSYKTLKKLLKHLGDPIILPTASFLDNIPFGDGSLAGGELEAGCKRPAVDFSLESGSNKRRRQTEEDAGEPESVNGPRRSEAPASPGPRAEKHNDFLHMFKIELQKFNAFFLEKEEEFIIRVRCLLERTQEAKDKYGLGDPEVYEQMIYCVREQIVALHGEMVLLSHYSSLNFRGLVKILKKYDKRSGTNLRHTVLVNVLHQPFFSTKTLKGLIDSCLAFEVSLRPTTTEPVTLPLDTLPLEVAESEPIRRQILAALETVQDLR